MKQLIKKIPILGPAVRYAHRTWFQSPEPAIHDAFPGSQEYWRQRYISGGNSGAGSYDKFARFKAEILNRFVKDNGVRSVIEYGSGDGNQLSLAEYPGYIGFDVSPDAIAQCRNSFANDATKTFKLAEEYAAEKADLTLSLDVIYHLVEDEIFFTYIARLFDSSNQFVIIYSSNTSELEDHALHVKHRKFSNWVDRQRPQWKLIRHVPNLYPHKGDPLEGSFADFFIYEKM